jgi:hypothetical protein
LKATLILLTTIFAAVMVGCSDNLNVTDPLGGHNGNVQYQPKTQFDNGKPELLWSLDELKVRTISENIVENKAVYKLPPSVPPLVPTRGYKVSFEVYSNAHKTTNGYTPLAEVYRDDAIMYSGSDFTSGGEASVHKEMDFKGDFSQIKFYIALFQTDGSGNSSISGNSVQLTLKNINIYRIK